MASPFVPSKLSIQEGFRTEARFVEEAVPGTLHVTLLTPFLAKSKTTNDIKRGYSILPDGSQGVLVKGGW